LPGFIFVVKFLMKKKKEFSALPDESVAGPRIFAGGGLSFPLCVKQSHKARFTFEGPPDQPQRLWKDRSYSAVCD